MIVSGTSPLIQPYVSALVEPQEALGPPRDGITPPPPSPIEEPEAKKAKKGPRSKPGDTFMKKVT